MDLSKISPLKLATLGVGLFTLLLSFVPFFYRVSVDGDDELGIAGQADGINAWHELGVLAMLVFFVAVAVVFVRVFFAEVIPAGIPTNLIALALGALSLLLLLLTALTIGPDIPSYVEDSVSAGLSFTGYLQILTTIAFVALTALGFKESGEKMPEFNANTFNGGGQPPAGPTPPAPPAAGPTPPAAPPTAPPAAPTTPPAPPADPAPPAPPAP